MEDGQRMAEKANGRSVMGRIGIEPQGDIIPTGNGADFRQVSRHERVCGTFVGGQANERSICCVCGLRLDSVLAQYQLGRMHRQVKRLQVRIVKAVQVNCVAGFSKGTLKRLEPCAGKLASTVLRGGSGGNVVSSPDFNNCPFGMLGMHRVHSMVSAYHPRLV